MLCIDCNERPKHRRERGGAYSYCLECKRRRNREQAKVAYAAERGEAYRPQFKSLQPLEVPIELRIELAGFARELGFGSHG